MTTALPWKPSRRALSSTSTMVSPEPISTIDLAAAVRSADTISYGASAPVERGCKAVRRGEYHDIRSDGLGAIELDAIAPTFADHGARHRSDDAEPDIRLALGGFKQPLADIFAEQLPRQKRMGERL